MSLECIVWALRVSDEKVGDAALRTLAILADYAGPSNEAYPSIKTLMTDRNVSRATVYRHLERLESAGYIAQGDQRYVAHLPANRRPTVWRLNAWNRGLNVETPDLFRGLTDPPLGVSPVATTKEPEPIEVSKKVSTPAPARASALVAFPGRDCIHGHEALVYTDPRTKRTRPRCPECRLNRDTITLAPQETNHA